MRLLFRQQGARQRSGEHLEHCGSPPGGAFAGAAEKRRMAVRHPHSEGAPGT